MRGDQTEREGAGSSEEALSNLAADRWRRRDASSSGSPSGSPLRGGAASLVPAASETPRRPAVTACCSPITRLPAAFGEAACGQRQTAAAGRGPRHAVPKEGASPTGAGREADLPDEPPRKRRKRGRRQPRRAASADLAEDLAEHTATPPREDDDHEENEENDHEPLAAAARTPGDAPPPGRLDADRLDSSRRPDAGALDAERERRRREEEEEEEEEERRQLERRRLKEKRAQWEEQWARRKEREDRERRKTVEHFYAEERPRFLLLTPSSSSSSSFSFRHTVIRHHLSLLRPSALLPVHQYPHLLSSFSPLTPPPPPPPPPPPHPSFFSSFLEGPGPFPLAAAFHAVPAHLPSLYAPPLPAVLPLQVLF